MPANMMQSMAMTIAHVAHQAVGQKRKYTGEPYSDHCKEVAELVRGFGGTNEMVCAAYLHDTLEDTQLTRDDLRMLFGSTITGYVWGLTDQSRPEDGNRAARKAIDRNWLAQQCAEVQTIKCADLISNTKSIVRYDPKFAATYLPEKEALLDVLQRADIRIHSLALGTLREAQAALAKLDLAPKKS